MSKKVSLREVSYARRRHGRRPTRSTDRHIATPGVLDLLARSGRAALAREEISRHGADDEAFRNSCEHAVLYYSLG